MGVKEGKEGPNVKKMFVLIHSRDIPADDNDGEPPSSLQIAAQPWPHYDSDVAKNKHR